MKKLFSFIVVLAMAFVLVGCDSSTIDSATKRLEDAGYKVEVLSGDDLAEVRGEYDEEKLINVFYVKTTVDNVEMPIALIYEFKSEAVLEEEMLREGASTEGLEDYFYDNLFVLDMSSYLTDDDIMSIIRGE